jgi:serine/threonine protein kinase
MIVNKRYDLRSVIAKGGFGEVWVAKDLHTDKDVAFKVVILINLSAVDLF